MAMTPTTRKRRLTREDWSGAALEAMAAGGVAAVSIDRLAKTLGATRGSFYWHFKDRNELIEVALERWEREHTTELIPRAEAIADPTERLRFLFREVYEPPTDPIESALAWADDPLVAPVVARVTRARLVFLRRIFVDLGLPEDEAADRAWLAYAFYVGHHQLGRNAGLDKRRPTSLDSMAELLTRPSSRTSPTAAASSRRQAARSR
jgi:AcrR family transcriptional regulator